MGVKFAKAMGAHVVMITTSESKGVDAMKLGADEVLISKDAKQMKQHSYSFDFLLNTIPVAHDVDPYLLLLRSEEHTSELQSRPHLVCRLLLEKKKKNNILHILMRHSLH